MSLTNRWHAVRAEHQEMIDHKLSEDAHPIVGQMHQSVSQVLAALIVIATDRTATAEELREFAEFAMRETGASAVPTRAS